MGSVEVAPVAAVDNVDRNCRICGLGRVTSGSGTVAPIDLGCSCKGDLAYAHQHCAATWFITKGDWICEICNSAARNLLRDHVVEFDTGAVRGAALVDPSRPEFRFITHVAPVYHPDPETSSCCTCRRLFCFLLFAILLLLVLFTIGNLRILV